PVCKSKYAWLWIGRSSWTSTAIKFLIRTSGSAVWITRIKCRRSLSSASASSPDQIEFAAPRSVPTASLVAPRSWSLWAAGGRVRRSATARSNRTARSARASSRHLRNAQEYSGRLRRDEFREQHPRSWIAWRARQRPQARESLLQRARTWQQHADPLVRFATSHQPYRGRRSDVPARSAGARISAVWRLVHAL